MEIEQQLDIILIELKRCKRSDQSFSSERIMSELYGMNIYSEANNEDFEDLWKKLLKDGFVYPDGNGHLFNFLTVDGELFINVGGYVKQKIRTKKETASAKRRLYVVAIVAALLGNLSANTEALLSVFQERPKVQYFVFPKARLQKDTIYLK